MSQTEAEWRTTSRPYRILAKAIELKRRGQLETVDGIIWQTMAKQAADELAHDPDLTPYGRFRLDGYLKAMGV